MNIIIHTIPAFQDNYLWLFHRQGDNRAAVVDPGDATPVLAALQAQQLSLAAILVTHQHPDHIGGVRELISHFPNCKVFGPADISVVTDPVGEGDSIAPLGIDFDVLEVPGHTLNHLAYFTRADAEGPQLFCGDTLFAGGCGRLFEGTPQQMYNSLAKLAGLPDATRIYCAHEYTAANLKFARAVEPNNQVLAERTEQVTQARADMQPTVPTVLKLEKQTNPFLRTSAAEVKEAATNFAGAPLCDEIEVFAAIRCWKDSF